MNVVSVLYLNLLQVFMSLIHVDPKNSKEEARDKRWTKASKWSSLPIKRHNFIFFSAQDERNGSNGDSNGSLTRLHFDDLDGCHLTILFVPRLHTQKQNRGELTTQTHAALYPQYILNTILFFFLVRQPCFICIFASAQISGEKKVCKYTYNAHTHTHACACTHTMHLVTFKS